MHQGGGDKFWLPWLPFCYARHWRAVRPYAPPGRILCGASCRPHHSPLPAWVGLCLLLNIVSLPSGWCATASRLAVGMF